MLERGYRLIATARKPEAIAHFVESYPQTARAARLDVNKPDEIQTALNNDLESWIDLRDEDGIHELPFAPDGTPTLVEGRGKRQAIYKTRLERDVAHPQ